MADFEAPWVLYPDTEPWWGGWRQGNSEHWLWHRFLPWWRSIGPDERLALLDQWQASDAWREYLLTHWLQT